MDCFASLAMTDLEISPRRGAPHRGLSCRIGGPQIEAGRNIGSVDAELAAVEQRLQPAIHERRRRLAAVQFGRHFDQQRRLRYEGRVDNSQRESLVKTQDARNALDALLAGTSVPVPHTGVFGCSTKWKSKHAGRMEEMAKIEAEPVKLEAATAEDLKKLRANPGGKVLLVNFWATWCGPCVSEFPDLETTYRMYRGRDFDYVTVSANLPDERPGVLRALEKQHATGRNLQFASDDTYAMQAAFDPKWEAGVPFTVLLAPGGKVLYQKQGELDILELRRTILANLPDADYIGHRAYWAAK